MVPHVAESPRRVDKTAVLRFSAHGMRIDYGTFLFYIFFYMIYKKNLRHQHITRPKQKMIPTQFIILIQVKLF